MCPQSKEGGMLNFNYPFDESILQFSKRFCSSAGILCWFLKNGENLQQNNSLLDNLFAISTNVLMCPQSEEGGMPNVNDPFEHGCAFQRIFPLHSSQSSKNALISGAWAKSDFFCFSKTWNGKKNTVYKCEKISISAMAMSINDSWWFSMKDKLFVSSSMTHSRSLLQFSKRFSSSAGILW